MIVLFKRLMILSVAVLTILLSGCMPKTITPVDYTQPQLKYLILSHFNNVFWCDTDFYPVARPGQEEQNALEQFPSIRADGTEFSAIIKHLGLPDESEYTDSAKLQIYREYKKLNSAVQLMPDGNKYDFSLRVGEGQGERIEGTISSAGVIKVLKREPSFNTCPICLVEGTLIDTPAGQRPVQDLRDGMPVWTIDSSGNRMAGVVVKTTSTEIISVLVAAKVTLDDGRSVTASPGHPTADSRALGDYRVGDILDGAHVMAVEYEVDSDRATYDLLPSGGTGLYWVNGILLKSTLETN
jgi:hypothetical protein